MADPDRVEFLPLSEVFPDVQMAPLPDGCVTETVFVFSKARFDDGTTAWYWRSPGAGVTNQEELLGALIMQVEVLKAELLDSWE